MSQGKEIQNLKHMELPHNDWLSIGVNQTFLVLYILLVDVWHILLIRNHGEKVVTISFCGRKKAKSYGTLIDFFHLIKVIIIFVA